MSASDVPRLDLAPKLSRSLSLRRPLDYLRLLYWALFFPQALRWYVEQFGRPEYQATKGHRAVWRALRYDPLQRRLVLQALISPFLAVGSLGGILKAVGVPIDASGALGGLLVGVLFGVLLGVAVSIGLGLAGDQTVGVTSGVAAIVVLGVALGVAFGITGAVILGAVPDASSGLSAAIAFGGLFGVLFGVASGVAFGMAGGVAFGATSDAAFGVTSGLALAAASGVAFCIVFGIVIALTAGAAAGVLLGVAIGVVAGRLLDWLLAWPLTQLRRNSMGGSRMVWLPLPGIQHRLERWLEGDWDAGVHNVNQILAYTLQFIPSIGAVNAALARSSEDQLLTRAAALAGGPFYWNMLYLGSTSLGVRLRRRVVDGLLMLPRALSGRRKTQPPIELLMDTPARAACAGFWAWHEGNASQAADAFAIVRRLRHGPELHGIAQAIVSAQNATALEKLATWETATAWLDGLSESSVRPGTLAALRTLRAAAADARVAQEALAPLNRSAALGRANAALTRLIDTIEATCPYPEWPLIKESAEEWRDLVSLAGGVVGEEVLRQPVLNPYEGYSGLPVTGSTFLGRADILRQIETHWAAGDLLPPLIIYGHRRMGKSSILRNLANRATPGTLLVYLDMQDAGWVDHTGQLLLDLAEALHRVAIEAGLDVGPSPAEIDYADLGTARRALNNLLHHLHPQMAAGRRLILAVDEFELIEEGIHAGRIDAGLLPYLRAVNQRYRWLALIFAGLHTLEEMGRDYRSAFYGQAEHLRVSYLSYDNAMRLITQPHPDFALEYAPDLREELYYLTFGQPYLLQRLCWELVTRWNERFLREGKATPRTLTLDDLAPVLTPDFFHGAGYYFDGVWSNVTDGERALMCILAREPARPWTLTELAAETGQTKEMVQANVDLLCRHDVIVDRSGSVGFASELMRRWVAERRR